MIGHIALAVEPLSSTDVGEMVFARFSQSPELSALPIIDAAGRPIGIITRSKFFGAFANTWGRPLYERRPITLLMDDDPLLVDAETPLALFSAAIVDRQQSELLEGFIITQVGQYLGMGDGMALLRGALIASQSARTRTERLQSELDRLLHARTAHGGTIEAFVARALTIVAEALQVDGVSIWRFCGPEAAQCVGARSPEGDGFGAETRVCLALYPAYRAALARSRVVIATNASAHPAFQDMIALRLLSPAGHSFLHAKIGAGADEQGFLCCESRFGRRDWSADEASFCASAAEILGLAFAAHDVELARAAAEHANIEKSTFLANMSHELRTPLNAIIGFSEILLEDAVAAGHIGLEADQRRVLNASQHLLKVINEVLDLSKVEAGKISLEYSACDPKALAQAVAEQVMAAAKQNGNRFQICLQDAPSLAYLDSLRVTQCLLNLLSNAAKFTKNGEISLRVTQKDMAARGAWLVFEVSDTGIGMSEAQAARVFQPFMQADASITRRYGGTGLGLALTRRFANLMGGDVTLSTAPGRGSTFWLHVPMHTCAPQAAAAA